VSAQSVRLCCASHYGAQVLCASWWLHRRPCQFSSAEIGLRPALQATDPALQPAVWPHSTLVRPPYARVSVVCCLCNWYCSSLAPVSWSDQQRH
jgi:hypothetical protein